MPGCIFCKISSGEVSARKIYETDDIVAFIDINPQAPTHILIAPKKHIARLSDATDEDLTLLGKIQLAAGQIAKEHKIEHFRLVANNGRAAGQTVEHLHYHLLAGRKMSWPPG